MGIGPIPSSKIKAYAVEDLDLAGEELDRFRLIIRAMDDEYISLANSSDKVDPKIPHEVAVEDVHGVRQIFKNIDERKKSNERKPERTKK